MINLPPPPATKNWSERDWTIAERVILALRGLPDKGTIEIRWTVQGELIFYTRTSSEIYRMKPDIGYERKVKR